MKTELENRLFEKYPRLFQQKALDMQQTCLCWGIECGDGWYELLDSLCHCIEEHFWNKENHKRLKENKVPLEFDEFKNDISLIQYTTAAQVKEKFGGLRFYISKCETYVNGVIRMAELMSYKICEICGKPGKPNKGPWITTRCEDCKDD